MILSIFPIKTLFPISKLARCTHCFATKKELIATYSSKSSLWCIMANKGDPSCEDLCQPLQQQTSLFIHPWLKSALHHSTTHRLALPVEALAGPHTSSWRDCSGCLTWPSQHRTVVWFNLVKFNSIQFSILYSAKLQQMSSQGTSMIQSNSSQLESLLTGRNLWQNQTQEGWPSASTSWGLRGQERGNNKHHSKDTCWNRDTQVNDNNNAKCT